ncbi:MAG TPA: SRPBCC family protein [Acidimicrobiia bacterium]|nr:SRPBCC family protein [Acidimicrobiia bacterium]
MATHLAQTTIATAPATVWATVGDFGGLASWMPGIDSCSTEGDERVVGTMGMEIRERLVRRDDATRTLAYSITASPMPLEHHEVEIVVHDDGDGSRVTWEVTVVPDELAEVFGNIYQSSLDALRAHCETGG